MVPFTISYGQRRTNIVGRGSVEDYYCMYSIIGIDEVGVGSVAGPMVVCAVHLPEEHAIKGIRDSKKLTGQAVDTKAIEIRNKASFAIAEMASAEEIDAHGVRVCHMRMMFNLIRRAKAISYPCDKPKLVVIDGECSPGAADMPFVMIKQADDKSYNVGAASIVAKSVLDKMMVVSSYEHPGYGFESNKGYPTPAHRDAVSRLGTTPLHRLSYTNFYR